MDLSKRRTTRCVHGYSPATCNDYEVIDEPVVMDLPPEAIEQAALDICAHFGANAEHNVSWVADRLRAALPSLTAEILNSAANFARIRYGFTELNGFLIEHWLRGRAAAAVRGLVDGEPQQ